MAELLPRATAESNVLHLFGAGLRSTPSGQGVLRWKADIISSSDSTTPWFNASIYANLFDDEGKEIILLAGQPENCQRIVADRPGPVRLIAVP